MKNISTKFHPDQTWNDGALSFFEDGRPNKNKNSKMNIDMGSVYDPKNYNYVTKLHKTRSLTEN